MELLLCSSRVRCSLFKVMLCMFMIVVQMVGMFKVYVIYVVFNVCHLVNVLFACFMAVLDFEGTDNVLRPCGSHTHFKDN